MSDRELLEAAARAACIELEYCPDSGFHWITSKYSGLWWDPLNVDGDAFRLLVKLQLELTVFRDHVTAFHATSWCDELHGSDPLAATRRAIVRAAAEIASRS